MADSYRIMAQRQNVVINPAGTGFMNVWEITYQVIDGPSRGTTATITVPDEDHNADYVKAAIEEKIAALDAIHSL